MRRLLTAIHALSLATAFLLLTAADAPKEVKEAAPKAGPAKAGGGGQVERGAYLVTVGACNDCHTPMKMTPIGPLPDMSLMLSGHPESAADPVGALGATDIALAGTDLTVWKQPFGTVYTRNLTPDKTGLGDWTEEMFVKTIRNGRHQGDGRALLPPMPWPGYRAMSDADLKAVWAYLRTIKPIRNTVPDPKVPPPVHEQFLKVNATIIEMQKGAGAPK
jgi:mono/diheme cytochrome c family protein